MRVYIDSLTNQIENEIRTKEKITKEYENQLTEIKREKRRLDDLLTIREIELESFK